MKKFLITLIVTMLTCIGAWAEETILINGGESGTTTLSAFKMSSQEVENLHLKVGDVLKLYWKATTDGYASVSFLPTGEWTEIFGVNTNNDGIHTDWTVKEFELTEAQITSLEKGFSATWEQNITLQKLTLVHYAPATGVTLNKSSISLGIGATDNTLEAHVEAAEGEAKQIVTWSVEKISEEDPTVITVDPTTGVITGVAAGTAKVVATVPGTELTAKCTVTVKQGYTLTATADPTSVTNAIARTITINPVVKLGDEVLSDGFTLSYSLIDNTDDKVSIDGNVVSVEAGATPGSKIVSVSVTDPNDVYAGATTKVNFTVTAAPYLSITNEIPNVEAVYGTYDWQWPTITIQAKAFNGNGTEMSTQPTITYTAEIFEDNDDIVTLTQDPTNSGAKNVFRVSPGSVGTTKVKVTASATIDGVVTSDYKVVDVAVVGNPLKFKLKDGNLKVNYDQPLTLEIIKAAIDKVYTGFDDNPTIVNSGYEIEVTYNGGTLVTDENPIPAQGANAPNFDITISVKATVPEYTNAAAPQVKTVEVTNLQRITLGLTTDKTSIMDNGQKATINPTATFNDEAVEISSYTVFSNNPDVADVVKNPDNTITVTGKNVGTVTVTVIATPTDNDSYAAATNSIDITVEAAPRVSLSKETIDGKEYVVVNVPVVGAFGGISDTPKYTSEDGTTLEMLKDAANVKVTGYLSISDMQELNHLVGDAASMKENVCTTLDMGEAQLTEEVKLEETNNSGVTRINFIDQNDFYSHRMLYVENLILPQPSPSYTVLPEGMYGWVGGNTSSLKSLTIPDGWTKAAANSFSPDAANGALVRASSLTLPSTLTYIGENAFAGVKAPVIMIPPLVTYIGDGAFSSSDPCDVADIYFTGHAPTYVGQRAFSTAQQMGNNTTNNTVVASDGRTDRNFLVLSGKNVCLMHYPAEYEDEYIDKSRKYTATDRFGDGIKDYNTPYNPGWTDEQLSALNAARIDAREENSQLLAFDFSNAFDPGYRDLTVSDRIWPSQQLMTAAYTMAWIGYHWDGTPMTQAELDKRGLYQFITTMSDAPDHPSDWEFEGYEADKWYTINLPFDMSVEQIKKVFGADTQVCRFSKVTRNVGVNPEDNTLVFEFRNSVMTADALDGDGNPSTGNLRTYHHSSTGLAGKEPNYTGHTGIVHGTPYMIKPKGTTDCPIEGEGHQIKRTFKGYVMIGEANNIESVTATDGSVYSFAGVRRLTPLLAGTYFLGRKSVTSRHQYFFYLGGSKQRTPYTAALFAADGGSEDGRVFFDVTIDPTTPDLDGDDSDEPSTTHAAPVNLISLFGDDEGVNTIENFTILCGDDKMPDNKVYNVNGQLVNGKNLPVGLYIKNGKKFIVK